MCTRKVKSLKVLAAEVVPQDTILKELPIDIRRLIKHNRITIITCTHDTKWSHQRGIVNGIITHTCGCESYWHHGKYMRTQSVCKYILTTGLPFFPCSTCLCGMWAYWRSGEVTARTWNTNKAKETLVHTTKITRRVINIEDL